MKKIYLLAFPLLFACSNNKSSDSGQLSSSTDTTEVKVSTDEEENEAEGSYILTPGETYYTSKEVSDDGYGNKSVLTIELTAYKDKSFSGQVIETVTLAHRADNPNEHKYPIEGEWEEISKHDKKFMQVKFELTQSGEDFTLYIDEDLNAYMNDLSSTPEKLYKK